MQLGVRWLFLTSEVVPQSGRILPLRAVVRRLHPTDTWWMKGWAGLASSPLRPRTATLVMAALGSLFLVQTGSTMLALVTTATLIALAILLLSGERRHDAIRRSRYLLLAALTCAFTSALMAALYELV